MNSSLIILIAVAMAAFGWWMFTRRKSLRMPPEAKDAARRAAEVWREGNEYEKKETEFRHPHNYDSDKAKEYQALYKAKYSELIPIGQELYSLGGHALMLQAAEHVRELEGDLAARYIERYWNGIGEWQG